MKTVLFALAASALVATAAVATPSDNALQHHAHAPDAIWASSGKATGIRMRQVRDVEAPGDRSLPSSSFDWDVDRNNG
ncbi:hypothetical protein [Hansschlegelia sp. KR7-227]|uniref:hypothetical protein n=1 Tax=Hansschlegelia sp. KR7-227 TaxID=3400914 RepID=UPI003C060181